MAAYLDIKAEMWGSSNMETLAAAMAVRSGTSHRYLLNPVSATATLKRHCSTRPLNSRKQVGPNNS